MDIMAGSDQSAQDYSQCQEAVKKLTEYLSHELRPEEEASLQKHLSECRGCFSRFHFEETLLRTIRDKVEQVHAPPILRERILSLLNKQDGSQERAGGKTP
jgi:anti-sigma factor (TIGR02949 family)